MTKSRRGRKFFFVPAHGGGEANLHAELAARELARRRLDYFMMRFNERYMMSWMHADICHRLTRISSMVDQGLSPRAMFLMPPRHGKSTLVSKNFPAWHLGRYPTHEYIAASYAASLAVSFSREVRTLLRDPAYQVLFPDTLLDPENQAVEDWKTTARGGYIAAGVGGGITGRGAHILSIDDPVKNAEEADSKTIQEANWDWFGSTAYTRLAPGGGVLVTMTCWNLEDIAGKIEQLMLVDPLSDQYEIVRYAALADDDEWLPREKFEHLTPWAIEKTDTHLLLRRKGDPLHPERYDYEQLMRIKRTLTERYWAALYQQKPIPDEGLIFTTDMFHLGDMPDRLYSVPLVTWDFAITEKTSSDYTVGAAGWLTPSDTLHVHQVQRFRSADTYTIVEAIINMVAELKHPGVIVGLEDGHIFKTLLPVLERRMRERKVYFVIEKLQPLTDKLLRARPLQARMQQKRVTFQNGAQWYDAVRNELLRFPAGGKDDIVDTLAWLAQLALRVGGKRVPESDFPREQTWRDKLEAAAKRGGSYMSA